MNCEAYTWQRFCQIDEKVLRDYELRTSIAKLESVKTLTVADDSIRWHIFCIIYTISVISSSVGW